MEWPFIPRNQWNHDSLDWMLTSGKKQKNKIKYRLYWSNSQGGLWVSNE